MTRLTHPGVAAALGAALLFGAGTPLAKLLLGQISPWLMAGLLYLGSGIGLAVVRAARPARGVRPARGEWHWLAAVVATGGVVGPVLLMWGLARMPASGASLLLNAEAVFTALIAWFVFHENVDRRIALGMVLIVAGGVLLAWSGSAEFGSLLPALAVLGACLAWGLDNNLTRKLSLADPTYIAMVKGLAAGTANVAIALAAGAVLPGTALVLAAAALGFASYGASIALFVLALRHLGTARTGAYFSTAPFVGAVVAVALLGEPVTVQLAVAGALMAAGVWLHLTESHRHAHAHEAIEHEHEHEHDLHHRHAHEPPVPEGVRHTHRHRHEPLTHEHAHFPDAHHRHSH